jgi:DNA-binding CsgD family transcriptional regulator
LSSIRRQEAGKALLLTDSTPSQDSIMNLISADLHPVTGVPGTDLDETIALIYRAAGEPSAWRGVARLLAQLFDAEAVALCRTDGSRVNLLGEGLHNLSQEDALSLLARQLDGDHPVAHHSGDAAVHTVNDARLRHGLKHLHAEARVLTVLVPDREEAGSHADARLCMTGGEGRPPLSTVQTKLQATLSRHLLEAMRSEDRWQRQERSAELQGRVLLYLGRSWLVIDRGSRLIDCNPLARCFLRRSDLMSLRNGNLTYPKDDFRTRLEDAMGPVWSGVAERSQVTLDSREQGMGIRFEFIPALLRHETNGDPPEQMLILVREVERDLALRIETMAEAFKLSRSERRVTKYLIRHGMPPADIAVATGTSVRTIRCQLSSIFRKTGTESQQDLIRMTLAG